VVRRQTSRIRAGATIACVLAAGCGVTDPLQGHAPCWAEDPAFVYEPMTLEGVIQVERRPPNHEVLYLVLANGRFAELLWSADFRVQFGPGLEGRVLSPHFQQVVAQSGQHVTLWGALVRAETSSRAPASPGMDGFVVCLTNGVASTPPPR